jgi:hypothetical protein
MYVTASHIPRLPDVPATITDIFEAIQVAT